MKQLDVDVSPPVHMHGGLICIAFWSSGLEKKIISPKVSIMSVSCENPKTKNFNKGS